MRFSKDDVSLEMAAKRSGYVFDDVDGHILIAGLHSRDGRLTSTQPAREFGLGHAGTFSRVVYLLSHTPSGAGFFKALSETRSFELLIQPFSCATSFVFVLHSAHPCPH